MVEVFFMEVDHVQDEVCFLLEGADLLVELCDPDGVEGGHRHGCDRGAEGNELFGSAWH